MNNLDKLGETKMPSIINDPFKQSKITAIHVHFTDFMGKWTANGSVEFKNGLTCGEQKFRANTFGKLPNH